MNVLGRASSSQGGKKVGREGDWEGAKGGRRKEYMYVKCTHAYFLVPKYDDVGGV